MTSKNTATTYSALYTCHANFLAFKLFWNSTLFSHKINVFHITRSLIVSKPNMPAAKEKPATNKPDPQTGHRLPGHLVPRSLNGNPRLRGSLPGHRHLRERQAADHHLVAYPGDLHLSKYEAGDLKQTVFFGVWYVWCVFCLQTWFCCFGFDLVWVAFVNVEVLGFGLVC